MCKTLKEKCKLLVKCFKKANRIRPIDNDVTEQTSDMRDTLSRRLLFTFPFLELSLLHLVRLLLERK